ncbi:MAG: ribonuclease HI family protein [Chloroflexota bacterium]
MSENRRLILETDGASRGNPGLSGAGVIIRDEQGHKIESLHEFLGVGTNNQAEYRALILGLKAASRHLPVSLQVRSDSELLVKQMTGVYRVRHPEIVPLYLQAREATDALPEVTYVHVMRERNREADMLANAAIDTRMVPGRAAHTE